MWWPMIRKSKEEKTVAEAEKKEIAELEKQKRILEMEKLKSEIKKKLEDTTKSKWDRWMEAVKLGGKLFGQLVLLPVGAVQVAPVVAVRHFLAHKTKIDRGFDSPQRMIGSHPLLQVDCVVE